MGETIYEFPVQKRELPRCPDCGMAVSVPMPSGRHAVIRRVVDGNVVLIDCLGRVVR
jgi:hypothetical protein